MKGSKKQTKKRGTGFFTHTVVVVYIVFVDVHIGFMFNLLEFKQQPCA